ncbi:MAG: hypothetical protein ACJ790_17375 [Myxococcaceae bacterium]
MKPIALLAVPLALSFACSSSPVCEAGAFPQPTGGLGGGAGGGPGFEFRDDSAAVTLVLQSPETFNAGCATDTVVPERVSSEVLNPFNDEVPSQSTFTAASGGSAVATALVTFTPTVPGPYHVTATFAPVGGRAQHDLLVVKDRTKAPATTFNRSCSLIVSKLSQGTVICDGAYVDGSVGGAANLTPWFSVSQQGMATDGHVIWTWDGSRVNRFVETAHNVITHDPNLASATLNNILQFVPGDTEAIAIDGINFTLLRVVNGSITPVATWAHGMAVGTTSAAVRTGKYLVIAEASYASDPNSGVSIGQTHACTFDLTSLESSSDPKMTCRTLPGSPYASNPDGVWTWDSTSFGGPSTVRLFSPQPDTGTVALIESLTVAGGPEAHSNDTFHPGQLYFSWSSGTDLPIFVPRKSDAGLILEHYDSSNGASLNTSESAIWYDNGTTRAYFTP